MFQVLADACIAKASSKHCVVLHVTVNILSNPKLCGLHSFREGIDEAFHEKLIWHNIDVIEWIGAHLISQA